MVRGFLAAVGLLYGALAIWCAVDPNRTSETVGFKLKPGAGQSEFLTVYGGLEMGLALVFLWPLYRPGDAGFALFACFAIHLCLVVFRTIGFFAFADIPATTVRLAVGEWAILLVAGALLAKRNDLV